MAATKKKDFYEPVLFSDPIERPPIDEWIPQSEDLVFHTVKGAILMDVSSFFGIENNPNLDSFYLKAKRSYNNEKVRLHTVHYLNYFEKFYDHNRELPAIYSSVKYLIDYEPAYSKDAFFYDIRRYIIYGPISILVDYLVNDNYCLDLTYRNKKNPALQYLDKHAKVLMKISMLMNMMIPLVCHFMSVRGVKNSVDFLLEIYDDLLHINPDIDIYSKLYETALSNVEKSAKNNPGIFNKQDIRGINVTTHSMASVVNLILNLVPKYVFNANIIHLCVLIAFSKTVYSCRLLLS